MPLLLARTLRWVPRRSPRRALPLGLGEQLPPQPGPGRTVFQRTRCPRPRPAVAASAPHPGPAASLPLLLLLLGLLPSLSLSSRCSQGPLPRPPSQGRSHALSRSAQEWVELLPARPHSNPQPGATPSPRERTERLVLPCAPTQERDRDWVWSPLSPPALPVNPPP